MSKSAILGIIAACSAGCLLVGILVLSRLGGEHTERAAVREAIGPAIQQAIHQAADKAGRHAVGEAADKLPPAVHEGAGTTQPANAAPIASKSEVERDVHEAQRSVATPMAVPIQVERKAFAITLPPGAAVDPEEASIGSEHLVTADMPGHGTLSIVVFDDKERARTGFEDTLAKLRGNVEQAAEEKPESFNSLKTVRATGMRGTVKGEEFRYEIGQCEGWDKGFVITVEYPDENKEAATPMMAKALGTFRMKQ